MLTPTPVPTDFVPSLEPERLSFIVSLIAEAGDGAISSHDAEAGETPISRGVRRWERAMKKIMDAADSGQYPWLEYDKSGLDFLILVDKFPIKFYRENPNYPNKRKMTERRRENERRQLALEGILPAPVTGDESDYHWRLFYLTDPEEDRVFRGALVRVNEKNKEVGRWDIDLADGVARLSAISEELPEGPDLDVPPVGPLQAHRESTSDGNVDRDE